MRRARMVRIFAAIVCLAFMAASTGHGEEPAAHNDEAGGHHCITSCSAPCCKSLVPEEGMVWPPSFQVSSFFVPEQSFIQNLVIRNIEHPPKQLA